LFLFNPNRVLANILKPSAELIIPSANKLRAESRLGYEALPTPTTLVLAEALTLLLNRIKKVPNDTASS
jgi:hypothetical protein